MARLTRKQDAFGRALWDCLERGDSVILIERDDGFIDVSGRPSVRMAFFSEVQRCRRWNDGRSGSSVDACSTSAAERGGSRSRGSMPGHSPPGGVGRAMAVGGPSLRGHVAPGGVKAPRMRGRARLGDQIIENPEMTTSVHPSASP
jgi:hypothetical protein